MKKLLLICLLMSMFTFARAEDMPLLEWFTVPPKTFEVPSEPETGEIRDSWDEIIAAIDDGTARQRYAVGAWKPLDLGEFGVINMQLAGFELDVRADGNGMAATTWIAIELLPEKHRMNPDSIGMADGWEKSELRAYLQDTVMNAIPTNVRTRLVSVTKRQCTFGGWEQRTEDQLWIPDIDEIFGENSTYYDLFQDDFIKRIKQSNGSAAWWWLRSATNYAFAHTVNYRGSNINDTVNNSGGVALGFCL